MAKNGNHSQRSGRHGREGWITWLLDQLENKHKSKLVRKWIAVLVDQLVDENGLLIAPEKFKSSVSDLRPHPADSWGYRFASRAEGNSVPAKSRQKANSKQKPAEKHDRSIQPGQPLIDLGALGLVGVPMGNTSLPANKLDEKYDPYSNLLDDAGFILREYDYVHERLVKEKKKKDKKGKITVIPAHTIQRRDARKPDGEGAEDNLKRMTVDLSPGLSRAVQLMIESGLVEEARDILDALLPEMAKGLEEIYPGAKVVGCGWHVMSGQLHADFWAHCTKLEVHELGEKATPTLCRVWDPTGLAHQGPGPGICAWDRHMAALGEEMETLAPGTCREVREALRRQEERAVLRGRAGVANRDIAIHRRFDEMVSAVLPDEYVNKGMEAYREHLRAVYANGDPKLTAVVSDPERQRKYRKQVAEGLKAARKLARDAEKVRADAAADLEKARDERRLLERREAAIPALHDAAELRGLAAAHKSLFPGRKPSGKTADEIVAEIETGVTSLRDSAKADADTVRKEANAEAELIRKRETALTIKETALKSKETAIDAGETNLKSREEKFKTRESALPDLETAAELKAVLAAHNLLFPESPPVAKTADGIVKEIKSGIASVKDGAVADAEAILKTAKQEAGSIRKRVAGRLRTMRARVGARADRRVVAIAGIVVGVDRAKALYASGEDLRVPVARKLSWYRDTISTFKGIMDLSPPRGKPGSPLGIMVDKIKSLLRSEGIAPKATDKKSSDEPDIK